LIEFFIYEKKAPVLEFISHLANKLRSSEVKTLFYAIDVKEHDSLIKECGLFVDAIIDYT